jgi:hypothetical protein
MDASGSEYLMCQNPIRGFSYKDRDFMDASGSEYLMCQNPIRVFSYKDRDFMDASRSECLMCQNPIRVLVSKASTCRNPELVFPTSRKTTSNGI